MKKYKTKKISSGLFVFLIFVVGFSFSVFAASKDLVAWWKFDEGKGSKVTDVVSGIKDEIIGYKKFIIGVSGSGLKYDGYTTAVIREALRAPHLGKEFTLEAWVAIQAYPWGWCAIINQENKHKAGYYLGIDYMGHVGLSAKIADKWQECISDERIALMKWTHLVATFEMNGGMKIYINGQKVAEKAIKGEIKYAFNKNLQIGRNLEKMAGQSNLRLNIPSFYSFDGYLDEVKIYNRALNAAEVKQCYTISKPTHGTGMTFRKFPAEPRGPAKFAAYYCKLKYCEEWDNLWRVGPHADVVVLFDQAPYRFVFWRGTSYIPCWVSENGIWYNNQFNEAGEDFDNRGCQEPMSDKRCQYSRVKIIENNDARVVIHWRYALVDNWYRLAYVDSLTERGDWSDEYYTIYPDGIGIRKIHLWSTKPLDHGWQESIILIPPGKRPEDIIETSAVTMVNMAGQTHTYSWLPEAPRKFDKPGNANIQIINIKAKAKPFLIVSDKPFLHENGQFKGPVFRPYAHEIKKEISIFPWWNHWPVSQIPSDGRWAVAPDRAGHSSVSNISEWANLKSGKNFIERIMMHGLTDKPAARLAKLARSWLNPAKLKLNDECKIISYGYDESERAYMFECKNVNNPDEVKFDLLASEDSPVINPAFIIKNWGDKNILLRLNGKEVKRGKTFRFGHRDRCGQTDLIIWVQTSSTEPCSFHFIPMSK